MAALGARKQWCQPAPKNTPNAIAAAGDDENGQGDIAAQPADGDIDNEDAGGHSRAGCTPHQRLSAVAEQCHPAESAVVTLSSQWSAWILLDECCVNSRGLCDRRVYCCPVGCGMREGLICRLSIANCRQTFVMNVNNIRCLISTPQGHCHHRSVCD
jgi:hypothetical protein